MDSVQVCSLQIKNNLVNFYLFKKLESIILRKELVSTFAFFVVDIFSCRQYQHNFHFFKTLMDDTDKFSFRFCCAKLWYFIFQKIEATLFIRVKFWLKLPYCTKQFCWHYDWKGPRRVICLNDLREWCIKIPQNIEKRWRHLPISIFRNNWHYQQYNLIPIDCQFNDFEQSIKTKASYKGWISYPSDSF